MYVAEINITQGHSFSHPVVHRVSFCDLGKAKLVFDEVSNYWRDHEDRKNDLPKKLTIEGDSGTLKLPFDQISAISLVDYAHANEMAKGTAEAFPILFPSR